jgi:protoporphyrinogen oxidase
MPEEVEAGAVQRVRRVAIVGGGPGGLMTAYRLQQRCAAPFAATIYEASGRLGGKILTERFASNPATYEAGAAELYDYSHVGEDPLRELVSELGLTAQPMSGNSVIINDRVLNDLDDVARVYGAKTELALEDFDARAKRWMSPREYYDADWRESNADPMSSEMFYDELARVPDEAARRFLNVLVHCDLATETHLTSAAYGLQNYLMNDPDYMRLYTIEGGIERLTKELAARVQARVRLKEPVLRVERVGDEMLRVTSRREGKTVTEEYDYVVVALPNGSIPAIEWAGDSLCEAMHRHHVHYEHPAHYLRVSVLFRESFWGSCFQESYSMLDAFGGCCLYDETSRNGCRGVGVLGWLLAGDAAMNAGNHTDEELIAMVLEALPAPLQRGRELFLEGKVHRWIGTVNGLPGGSPVEEMEARHVPERGRANLVVVGDYLFDSTLNGVLDSAEYVADLLSEEIAAKLRATANVYSAAL